MHKLLLAVPLMLANVSATQSNIAPMQHPEIMRVDCDEQVGTAFRVGPHIILSVAHVTDGKGCVIDGEPVTVVRTQGDFVILLTQRPSNQWLKVDCGGFVKGRRYEAIGYARGLDTQTSIDLEGTGEEDWIDGKSRLTGVFTVIPGQSGGPVIDPATGAVVGTINSYVAISGDSGSVPLKSTAVCNHA